MAKPYDAQDHCQHLSRHRHSHEQETAEMAQGVVDEYLAYGAAGCEGEDGRKDRRIVAYE